MSYFDYSLEYLTLISSNIPFWFYFYSLLLSLFITISDISEGLFDLCEFIFESLFCLRLVYGKFFLIIFWISTDLLLSNPC